MMVNDMFNKGQHGIIPGRSKQTQLLSNNDDYDMLAEEERLDKVVFLDFTKAVDLEILL